MQVPVTASASTADFVRGLGADRFVDYSTVSFEEAIHDQEAVFDTLGGVRLIVLMKRLSQVAS